MWLISWLTGKASKVLEWFGGYYYTWRNRIKNFWSYLRQYRDQAYNWAINYLFPLIISYYWKARNYVLEKYNSAVAWTNKTKTSILFWINTQIQKVKNLLGYEVSELEAEDRRMTAKIHKGDSRIETEIKTWAERLFSRLLSPFSWIIDFRDLLRDLKELFTEENKGKLITLCGSLFSFILDFAQHPIRVLIAIIQPVFLELINFSVAYALGTVEAELPAWPDWSTSGRGGGGAIVPPGVKQDLVSPLRHLRISGYTFNNPSGHMGLDLGLSRGEPVYSMHSGTVEFVKRAFTGYGYQVTVRGGFWWTRYAHLEKIIVKPGQHVSKGEMLGRGDSTGNSTGDHLHLEIKYKGSFVDPKKILF